ncbi:MAG: DUF2807 domain-containing protein [Flavobacteriaceae bacterium]|nr:DUF2807 domain-containing protein [Flavobacteriaceae bacterium]
MKYFLTLLGVGVLVVLIFTFRKVESVVDKAVSKIENFDSKLLAEKKKGNSEVVEEVRAVADFSKIAVSGAIDVVLKQGKEQSVVVKTDSNLQENLTTVVEEGLLKLETKGLIQNYETLTVFVTVKDLKGIVASGATTVLGSGIAVKECQFSISGASKVDLKNFIVDNAEIKASGASAIHLEGKCEKLIIKASGASNVNLFQLQAQNVVARASGASDVDITALQTLQKKSSGASDIDYKGTPTLIKAD